ncbi:YihY/virulence factor BrkB family protein [Naumannella halotolerans]|uniref:Membrane protein n=1 Tax=Naumannella halotolerans TaxID=993414 RepID=A0A4R7J771_9ACTN|nr:YihY/virulence factor BrkB family protein [Naumannella halotolerans]TDT33280.1 membrane protein [Naumannella halotolerans]
MIRAALAKLPRRAWSVTVQVIHDCISFRMIGLAAESAFFALLSLPPIVFALVGMIGFAVNRFEPATIDEIRDQILGIAEQFLTSETIDSLIAPTIDEVLSSGRFDVVSIGFVIALWTGSRAIAVLIETVTLMYGLENRGFVRQRALSFLAFLAMLIAGAILIPLMLSGPQLIADLLPTRLEWLVDLYWPVVGLGLLAMVTTMFFVAVPRRERWIGHLPGAVWTVLMWVFGSQLLRVVLAISSDSTSIYGPLAAPIALLLWLYLMSLAILIGASLNSAISPLADPDTGSGETDPSTADPNAEDSDPTDSNPTDSNPTDSNPTDADISGPNDADISGPNDADISGPNDAHPTDADVSGSTDEDECGRTARAAPGASSPSNPETTKPDSGTHPDTSNRDTSNRDTSNRDTTHPDDAAPLGNGHPRTH